MENYVKEVERSRIVLLPVISIQRLNFEVLLRNLPAKKKKKNVKCQRNLHQLAISVAFLGQVFKGTGIQWMGSFY